MKTTARICIIGIGSSNGDDAAGWAVIDVLEEMPPLDSCLLHRASAGHQIMDLLDGHETCLLIDASQSGEMPGTIRRFDWPDGRIESLRAESTHGFGAAQALKLAESLDLLPGKVVLFAVEIASALPGTGPSPAVTAAVPELARLVHELVRQAAQVGVG
jgi:hydrogenase maturation protease